MFEPFFALIGHGPSLLVLGGTLSVWALTAGAVFMGPSFASRD